MKIIGIIILFGINLCTNAYLFGQSNHNIKTKIVEPSKKKLDDIKSISFTGASWFGSYYIGAYKALLELNPNICEHPYTYGSVSMGSLISASILAKVSPDDLYEFFLEKNKQLNHPKLFMCDKITVEPVMREFFEKILLPKIKKNPDVIKRLKVKISEQRNWGLYDHKYELNHYNLYDSLMSSCHIPYLTHKTFFHNNKIDGYLVHSHPKFNDSDDNRNVLFFGITGIKYDISYLDNNKNTERFYNRLNIIFPMKTEEFIKIYHYGYEDTMKYFDKN